MVADIFKALGEIYPTYAVAAGKRAVPYVHKSFGKIYFGKEITIFKGAVAYPLHRRRQGYLLYRR